MRRPFHTGLSDDLDVLINALEPEPGTSFITVSAHGSGEAALALAAFGADRVVAFDVTDSAELSHLLELKLAAARLFGREDYLALMGLRPASPLRRRALAYQLVRGLPEELRAVWTERRGWLEEGLFLADQQSRFARGLAAAFSLLAPRDARPLLLGGGTAQDRARAFSRFVDRAWLRRTLSAVGGRGNLIFPKAEWDASLYPREIQREPLAYLERLIVNGLDKNPLFSHALAGEAGISDESLLPPHLRPGCFDGLRTAAVRVRAAATFPGQLLPLHDLPPLAGAYLSNVIDYLEPKARVAFFANLIPALLPGAPVLVYSNEAFDKVPMGLGLELDEPASARMVAADRAHIYDRTRVYRRPGVRATALTAPVRTKAGPRLRVVH